LNFNEYDDISDGTPLIDALPSVLKDRLVSRLGGEMRKLRKKKIKTAVPLPPIVEDLYSDEESFLLSLKDHNVYW